MLERTTVRASVALAAYAEPVLEGRRVIVFGDSTSGLAEELIDRGARLVHVYDPDTARVAESNARNRSQHIAIAALSDMGLTLRDGVFDVGLVEDLTLTGPAHSVVKRLRRALSPRGVALVAAPNPEVGRRLLPGGPSFDSALDYYQLYDAVASEFQNVRMLGQTPFVGFAVVDFSVEDTPEPSLDTAFVPGGAEEPEWFIAFASAVPLRLDEFQIVQLPMKLLEARPESTERDRELGAARDAERSTRERMADLEAEVAELQGQLATARARDASEQETMTLRAELAKRERWVAEVEARAAVADARADEAEAELDSVRAEIARERAALGEPLRALEAQVEALREELGRETEESRKLRERVAQQDQRLSALTALEPEKEGDELEELEAQLRARGMEIRRLEVHLRRVERLGRELVETVEALSERNAVAEADLTAAGWSLLGSAGAGSRELEGQLERARAALQARLVLEAQARKVEPS
jgi:SAM-dependent methyltransferase